MGFLQANYNRYQGCQDSKCHKGDDKSSRMNSKHMLAAVCRGTTR